MSHISTDPIADMLTRIRNGIAVNQNEIDLPHSNLKESIAKILVETSFLSGVRVDGKEPKKTLYLSLAPAGQNSKITEIVRLSKPGRRLFTKAGEIPVVKRGRGLVIVSTSKGIMSGDQARENHLGGELICRVY